jgi:hypothetical protein
LRSVRAARQEATEVGEERDHDGDRSRLRSRRVSRSGHDNSAGVYCAASMATARSSRGDL